MNRVKGAILTAAAIVAATVATSTMWVMPAVAEAASKGGGKDGARGAKSETELLRQYNIGDGGINSQNYESTLDAYDDEAADDFAVPDRKQWDITKVTASGFFASESTWASVTAQSVLQPSITYNVTFFADAGGVPGEVLYTARELPASNASVITLPTPFTASVGTYWLSVQANLDYAPFGRWYWDDAWAGHGFAAKWRQVGNGFARGCIDWCDAAQGNLGHHMAFILYGFSR